MPSRLSNHHAHDYAFFSDEPWRHVDLDVGGAAVCCSALAASCSALVQRARAARRALVDAQMLVCETTSIVYGGNRTSSAQPHGGVDVDVEEATPSGSEPARHGHKTSLCRE